MSQCWRGSVQPPRVKTDECKDRWLFPAWLHPSNDTGNVFKYHFSPPFPHTLSFAILYPSTSIMCFKPIPVVSRPCSNITRRRQCNPANLRPFPTSFSMALWNCQSAVNKADFISTFSLQSTLSILGLTETWIRPEDSATSAALSNNFSFSYTPCRFVRGGATGLLI